MGRYVALTESERAALVALEAQPRVLPRGVPLGRDRESANTIWVLRSGWAAGALGMADGGRQIIKIYLPGDVLGVPGATPDVTVETLTAVTEIEVAAFGRSALAALLAAHPRLAALLLQMVQVERLMLGDRIAAIGRTDARARLAGLLCDLIARLRMIDTSVTDTLPLPLTQEEIGDALGLTAVHVNRMLRTLADQQLIAKRQGALVIVDEAALIRISGYANRLARIDAEWLPAPSA